MTIEEWAKDFKSYVNELDMPRDDYNGIMLYIDDALELLKEQEPKNVIADRHEVLRDDSYDEAQCFEDVFYRCPSCDRVLSRTHMKRDICFCEKCGQELKWE